MTSGRLFPSLPQSDVWNANSPSKVFVYKSFYVYDRDMKPEPHKSHCHVKQGEYDYFDVLNGWLYNMFVMTVDTSVRAFVIILLWDTVLYHTY